MPETRCSQPSMNSDRAAAADGARAQTNRLCPGISLVTAGTARGAARQGREMNTCEGGMFHAALVAHWRVTSSEAEKPPECACHKSCSAPSAR